MSELRFIRFIGLWGSCGLGGTVFKHLANFKVRQTTDWFLLFYRYMQKAIVLHSDILGFKKIIENSLNDKNDETLNKLKSALKESISFLDKVKLLLASNIKLNFKLFSDNLYASFSYNEDDKTSFNGAFETCIAFTRAYFETMLEKRLPIRGGISFGNDYSDESIIFSHALAKAYDLESKKQNILAY